MDPLKLEGGNENGGHACVYEGVVPENQGIFEREGHRGEFLVLCVVMYVCMCVGMFVCVSLLYLHMLS